MKDTIQEIHDLEKHTYYNMVHHSQITIDLLGNLVDDILIDNFNVGSTLYHLENLLEVFNPALKKDIEILEQLKEKLNRLNKMSL